MQKDKLISFTKRTSDLYPDNSTAKAVYDLFTKDPEMTPLFGKILSPEDVLIYSFMIPKFKEGVDLNGLYEVIKFFLTGIAIGQVEEHNPEEQCDECGGTGDITCSDCGGDGSYECGNCDGKGEFECYECDGEGEDSEGETCSSCQGSGMVDCETCDGNGNINCESCDGFGQNSCSNCDSNGKIRYDDSVKVYNMTCITYHPELVEKFVDLDYGDSLSDDDLNKLFKTNTTIVIKGYDSIEDDNILVEKDDEDWFFETELKNPKLKQHPNGEITIIWKSKS